MLYKLSNANTDPDLKKTVAVLLENLLDRVQVLEAKVDRLTRANRSSVGPYNVIQPPARILTSSTAAEGKSVNARGVFSLEMDSVWYWMLFLCDSELDFLEFFQLLKTPVCCLWHLVIVAFRVPCKCTYLLQDSHGSCTKSRNSSFDFSGPEKSWIRT